MLSIKAENIAAHELAIDRPSPKFVNFLGKHYQLNQPLQQVGGVIYIKHFSLIVFQKLSIYFNNPFSSLKTYFLSRGPINNARPLLYSSLKRIFGFLFLYNNTLLVSFSVFTCFAKYMFILFVCKELIVFIAKELHLKLYLHLLWLSSLSIYKVNKFVVFPAFFNDFEGMMFL